jgi:hypothetical protein
VSPGTRGERSLHDAIHVIARLCRKADENLGTARRIRDWPGREGLEERFDHQYHVDVFADDHAGCLFVGELTVELVAELGEELDGSVQVFDRQIDEDLRGYLVVSFLVLVGSRASVYLG